MLLYFNPISPWVQFFYFFVTFLGSAFLVLPRWQLALSVRLIKVICLLEWEMFKAISTPLSKNILSNNMAMSIKDQELGAASRISGCSFGDLCSMPWGVVSRLDR